MCQDLKLYKVWVSLQEDSEDKDKRSMEIRNEADLDNEGPGITAPSMASSSMEPPQPKPPKKIPVKKDKTPQQLAKQVGSSNRCVASGSHNSVIIGSEALQSANDAILEINGMDHRLQNAGVSNGSSITQNTDTLDVLSACTYWGPKACEKPLCKT